VASLDDPDLDLDPAAVTELARRAKVALRKRARGLRASIPAAGLAERSARIVARLAAEPALATAREVALFWPMVQRHEVDLRALDAILRERGVGVAYPRLEEGTRLLSFRLATGEALVDGPMGLREPAADAPRAAALDVVVVPCLLVEGRGYRLGYGGGWYDRTLPTVCPPAISIAVGYDFQLSAEVPIDEGDVAVDRVVVESRAFDADR
jgi:5-formyltetrahydrofolate cyclo-ligase